MGRWVLILYLTMNSHGFHSVGWHRVACGCNCNSTMEADLFRCMLTLFLPSSNSILIPTLLTLRLFSPLGLRRKFHFHNLSNLNPSHEWTSLASRSESLLLLMTKLDLWFLGIFKRVCQFYTWSPPNSNQIYYNLRSTSQSPVRWPTRWSWEGVLLSLCPLPQG